MAAPRMLQDGGNQSGKGMLWNTGKFVEVSERPFFIGFVIGLVVGAVAFRLLFSEASGEEIFTVGLAVGLVTGEFFQKITNLKNSLRILVIDADVDWAKEAAVLLRGWGHQVRMTYNGPDALVRVVDFQPHVILLNVDLPGIDGYEVAHRIRQNPQTSNVHLVAITDSAQEKDQERLKVAGFDEHLAKPMSPSELKELFVRLYSPIN